MHVSREQLESAVSKWFDGSISDYKCEALASTYLEHQDFRLYKYQNPFCLFSFYCQIFLAGRIKYNVTLCSHYV